MAWTLSPLFRCSVNFRDRAQRRATTSFAIARNASGVTEATARTKVLTLASAFQPLTNAAVQSTILRAEEYDWGNLPIDTDNPYKGIEDRVRLRIQPVPSEPEVPILLPVPNPAILLPNGETVDPANAAVQDVLSFLADKAFDYGFQKLTEYIGGERERARNRPLPPGVPLLPA